MPVLRVVAISSRRLSGMMSKMCCTCQNAPISTNISFPTWTRPQIFLDWDLKASEAY